MLCRVRELLLQLQEHHCAAESAIDDIVVSFGSAGMPCMS